MDEPEKLNPETNMGDGLWNALPDVMKRWVAGVMVGIVLGGGGSAAVLRSWPDANVVAIDITMKAVMDRIDKLERNDITSDLLMNERQRVGDSNALRIANLESRLASDISEIKTNIQRVADKLDRHSENTESKTKP